MVRKKLFSNMPCTVTDAEETMEKDSGISNNNETNSDSVQTGDLQPQTPASEADSVLTEAATATAVVLQQAANTVAEELAAASAAASMTSSAVTLETLSEDGSVGVGSAPMHHQMHHHHHVIPRWHATNNYSTSVCMFLRTPSWPCPACGPIQPSSACAAINWCGVWLSDIYQP